MFTVIPCIDIKAGRAVRLFAGDPSRETVYFNDPVEAAAHWRALGASELHLVDLDAALGQGDNRSKIEEIAAKVDALVEVGGGIRDIDIASDYLAVVNRVVLGTAAIRRPELIDELLARFGDERVVVSIDAKDGRVATDGWTEVSQVTAADLVTRVLAQGVTQVIYTDVARDGTLEGVDPKPVEAMRRAFPHRLVAGGGVASEHDLEVYRRIGLDGAIVGKALYEGKISYPRAS